MSRQAYSRSTRRQEPEQPAPAPTIRCAIYTRKSTEEGLEQEFNSLDAQREAAEAYIESQRHEGWTCLPDRYDDGGFSGGSMDRPAINRLLDDVQAGRVDCIVVYKVDRFSRSLIDFARMMESLERNNVSFVSVTQQFNTTTSMGRLTLNILLSFAQFEREIIAERTRDKMSSARRKGKWIGGAPVLGYDVHPHERRLVVNEEEAERVRKIYALYLEHQSLLSTVKKLNGRKWVTKHWITKKGRERGGKPFDKNNLFKLLTNITYIGKVKYKDEVYEGEHQAIVDDEAWRRVQSILRRNGRSGGAAVRNKYGALLKGLLYCIPCKSAMIHAYTVKNKTTRYRYYVCSKAQKQGWDTCPTKSLPAAEIERFVVDQIRCVGEDPELIAETLEQTQKENKRRAEELEYEQRMIERELKQHDSEVRRIVARASKDAGRETPATSRLADLQERIRTLDQSSTKIKEEILALNRETVGKQELAGALSAFDPVWESLSPREQARVIHLLVEQVGYDGEQGTMAMTFRPNGIKALAQEAKIQGKGT